MTPIAPQSVPESFRKTRLYQAFCAEKAEILRHKWIESEKAGRDIGFEVALIDWIGHHRTAWHRAYIARFEAENEAQISPNAPPSQSPTTPNVGPV